VPSPRVSAGARPPEPAPGAREVWDWSCSAYASSASRRTNAQKVAFTLAFVLCVILFRLAMRGATWAMLRTRNDEKTRFWMVQATNLASAALLLFGVMSIWFDNPERLTTVVGLFSAGLAFALQKVVTSVAGYLTILRSRAFTVGDRILMAGVRGDVISLGFVQTTIMEMGQSPGERPDDPPVWVHSRQFTGRIVTVTNDKIFEEPVFNYTREFPFIWEELRIPVRHDADWKRAEEIMIESADRNAMHTSALSRDALSRMQARYNVPITSLKPKVYLRITENWLELTLRFLSGEHGSTEIKDSMSREILAALGKADIAIASTTVEVVRVPELKLSGEAPEGALQPRPTLEDHDHRADG
jgi:small-conductance mechanosensitive channel